MSDLTVSLIQANLHWEDIPANLAMFDQKIDAIKERTEVIVLPEMFSTGFSMQPEKLAQTMDGSAVQWMKQKAKQKNAIITGSLIIEENGQYYNRLLWMLPNGQFGQYNKRHRFGFAGEDNHYEAGDKRLIASVKGWKICLTVCYDLRFPYGAAIPSKTTVNPNMMSSLTSPTGQSAATFPGKPCSRRAPSKTNAT